MPHASDSRILDLLDHWFRETEAGRDVDLVALCDGDTDLADRLRSLIALEPDQPATVLPERFGHYDVISYLGGGGTGRVYLAESVEGGGRVAVKILADEALGDPAARLRFEREAALAAALEHPNVVPIREIGELEGGRRFIAMKWLAGPSLDRVDAPLPPREVARIGVALADALAVVHRAGVLHRDVKPGNVILDGSVPYLVDFGLARGVADATVTRDGTIPGTLPYMAPELLQSRGALFDARTDVYALGATLYQIAAGRPAFEADTAEALVRAILTRDPVQLGLNRGDRPLQTIILRALDKSSARRFATADELADDLRRYLAGTRIRSRPCGPLSRVAKLARRNRTAAAAIAIALLLVGAVAIVAAISHARRSAILTEDYQRALDDLAQRDAEGARNALTRMQVRRPGDARVTELAERLTALDTLNRVLDLLLDRWSATEWLDAEVAHLHETRAPQLYARTSTMAAALADVFGKRVEAARRRVRGWERVHGQSHVSGAILAAIDATPFAPESLPPPRDETTDERVLVALAMHAARTPLPPRRSYVAAMAQKVDGDLRVQVLRTLQYAEAGDYAAAEGAAMAVTRDARATPAVVHRVRALLALSRGDLPAAEAALSRIEPSRRGALEAALDVFALWRSGDVATFEHELDGGLRQWPEAPLLLTMRGEFLMTRDRPAEAIDALDRAERLAWTSAQRDRAFANGLAARMQECLGKSSLQPRLQPGFDAVDLEELLEDVDAGLGRVDRPLDRSRILWVGAVLLRALRRLDDSADYLDRAVETDPGNPRPRADLVLATTANVLRHDSDLDAPLTALERRALQRAARLADVRPPPRRSHLHLTAADRVNVAFCAALIHRRLGDRAACRAAVERWLSAGGRGEASPRTRHLVEWSGAEPK